MKWVPKLFSFGFVALAALCVPAAKANVVFDLNVDGCSSSCGPAGTSFGTVELSTVDVDTVHVDVELTPEFITMFVQTGAGYALTWNGPSGETVANLASPEFNFLGYGSYSTGSNFGTFKYAIDCVAGGGACGNGASDSTTSSMTFDVSHSPSLALTDFFGTNPEGFFFSVDLIGPNGKTGVVGANTFTTKPDCTPGSPDCSPDTNVPEPATLALIAAGLIGGGFMRKRSVTRLA